MTEGKLVEILAAEANSLHELAQQMERAARRQERGWLTRYVRAHVQASKIIQTLVNRHHTLAEIRNRAQT